MALAEITSVGYEQMTMQAVAARAGSSKESLYKWFGSKESMVAELIRRQAAATNAAVESSLTGSAPPEKVLKRIADNLLKLLTSSGSLALNRAAMTSPELADVLLQQGRHTTGPLIERYLERLHDDGFLHAPEPAKAFGVLYGLVIQDSQIRALLGEPTPSAEQRGQRAQEAVSHFLALTSRPPHRSQHSAS